MVHRFGCSLWHPSRVRDRSVRARSSCLARCRSRARRRCREQHPPARARTDSGPRRLRRRKVRRIVARAEGTAVVPAREPQPDEARVYAKTRFVWVRERAEWASQWIGYLWPGESVKLANRHPVYARGLRRLVRRGTPRVRLRRRTPRDAVTRRPGARRARASAAGDGPAAPLRGVARCGAVRQVAGAGGRARA